MFDKGYAEKLGLIKKEGLFGSKELDHEKARRVTHMERKKKERLLNTYNKRRDKLYQEAKECYKNDDTEGMQKKLMSVKKYDGKIKKAENKIEGLKTIEEKAQEEVLTESSGNGDVSKALAAYSKSLSDVMRDRNIKGESEIEELSEAERVILNSQEDVSDIQMDRQGYDTSSVDEYVDEVMADVESEKEEVEDKQSSLEDALDNVQT